MFEHKIRVGWGDCDPAQIAFTGRLPNFALEAIDAWWEDTTGADWFRMETERGLGTPFVGLAMDFRSPVTPRHPLICRVWPAKLGRTSITLRVDAFQDGTLCFEGRFTEVFVSPGTLKPMPPPAEVRALIEPLVVPEP